jgi:toxin ParE1/3/4
LPNLEWKATAIADLLAIIDYISDDNPDAAQVLKDEIEHKTSLLPERPQMYRAGRVDGTREMVIRPNYIVVYAESPEMVAQWSPPRGCCPRRRSRRAANRSLPESSRMTPKFCPLPNKRRNLKFNGKA